jgi:uncharacterized protein YeaO (DUF488 family)
MIRVKRIYEKASKTDGKRFLVDRLWPRGLSREAVRLEGWVKDVAPSDVLRRWFGHDQEKWEEFRRRYFAELRRKPDTYRPLLDAAQAGDITFLFGAKDEQHNNAVALREFLVTKLRGK